jgi:hypothetical protein
MYTCIHTHTPGPCQSLALTYVHVPTNIRTQQPQQQLTGAARTMKEAAAVHVRRVIICALEEVVILEHFAQRWPMQRVWVDHHVRRPVPQVRAGDSQPRSRPSGHMRGRERRFTARG